MSTASPIELIDIEGRKIVADIISKQGDDIKIRKADNKEYTISIAKLTKKTQNLIDLEMKTIANSKWNYSVSKDELTSNPIYHAVTESINQVNFGFPYEGIQRAQLNLRNHPQHGKDVILKVEKGQMLVRSYEDTTVEVVFDEEPPISFLVVGPNDHGTTSLFIRDCQTFTEKLMKSKKVKISVTFYKEGNVVFDFNVAGFDNNRYIDKK